MPAATTASRARSRERGRTLRGGAPRGGAGDVLGRALIRLQPGEDEAAARRRMGQDARDQRRRGVGRDAAATVADVDLDENRDRRLRRARRFGQQVDALGGVDGDREPDVPRQLGDARELGRPDDLVGDEDVVEARGRQGFGLARLLDADADRAGADLQPGDRRALVHLGVRAQAHAALAGEGRHRREVALHRVEVDHQGRRVDIGDGGTDFRLG